MKILIIQPSHYRSKSDLRPIKIRKRTLVPLSLPYLAALTPREWEVRLIDEQVEDIDFAAPVDMVAITTLTINALRAYDIADRFRERNVPVIMGGPHICFHVEEALAHCDAVGVGEGERIWPLMLADAAAGKLRRVYRTEGPQPLKGLPLPRYDLLKSAGWRFFKTFSLQSSRGCPFRCEFCSERFYLGESYRFRPVPDIIEEIRKSGARNLLFADSNFAGELAHTMELLESLIPLKITWSALWPAVFCTNSELMDLATRSGLLHLNLGFESIDGETLAAMNKKINGVGRYPEILANLRRRGISYSLNFIFGWETEKKDVFETTLNFLQRNRVPAAYFNILTPHKGTQFYQRMKEEGKILNIEEIGRWPGIACHIRPPHCSAREMEAHIMRMYRKFYTLPSMLKRLPLPVTKANIASWVVNFSQRRMTLSEMGMENFDAL